MQNTIVNGILVAINGIIFLGTIVLNLLAIVYILTTRDKTTIAMLVVNLAVADIIHACTYEWKEREANIARLPIPLMTSDDLSCLLSGDHLLQQQPVHQ